MIGFFYFRTLRYALRATQGAEKKKMKFNAPDSEGIKHVTSNPDHQYFDPSGVGLTQKDVRPRWGHLIITSLKQ
jgi:hypothetical protein